MTMCNPARALLLAFVLLLGTGAGAQPGPGGGPGPRGRVYDPKTVETVAGEVISVPRGGGPRAGGVHLVLRTDAGATLSVRLGPAWYVDRQSMKIAKGDRVEVKGSRVGSGGDAAIVAAEVRKGHDKLLLRDDAGVPAWSGAGRRRASP